ncbi:MULTISPECIES: lysine--tRNA ligase [unclassified Hydrogenobaculum]|uniref:lysine--tRNA ligase n=1 Tax=unclassified Hydrogenobaculum TaxID=2622382 RepID=UPI0001C52525|nr:MULTISPECIES: lysine--tRNA ligase [unclassified Hydrogenobaculum]AEF19373.1 lysyl-tRNA synthetase [Hydrogenobaculum sp. 3684]AEG46662.1 Lysyl-tRNA synthetase [Hydrogenobaculum sp. SHO]AGG15306.1 lysyl-tRNA synthetase, class II [Hydrogenobaculum sp. HO]AGH93608.1 lysyl-tRNA synthetase (class II) [Hydrogenobaculum sp. SN]
MEEFREKKLEELAKSQKHVYKYEFESPYFIHDIREKYEKEPRKDKIVVKATIKRVSKVEYGFVLRIASESGVEMLTYTKEAFEPNKTYNIEGILSRVEEKLSLIDAKPTEEAPTTSIDDIKKEYDLDPNFEDISIAGRLVALRSMGKAIFGHIQDFTGKLQIYIKKDIVGDEKFKFVEDYIDVGDIIGVKGKLFRTHTGELTVEVFDIELLTKALNNMPEKWHGIKDVEIKYRQRYLDLIANESSRKVFALRSKIIKALRDFFDKNKFMEVETPILQPIASGATARPFVTYHNYLESELYLRIAPELYLKKLIVGGIPRVYEIGKNFRNEGVDTTHNPEFTMVEFYAAYWDYKKLIKFTEELFDYLTDVTGIKSIETQNGVINLKPPFKVAKFFELLEEKTSKDKSFFLHNEEELKNFAHELGIPKAYTLTKPKLIEKVFEYTVEDELIQPTFIIDFPKILSPLAKTHRDDDELVERFELYINKKEIANAYSELNDPEDQAKRFLEQKLQKATGDEEAMETDDDFVEALRYGMPPTAGEGIGIDRLVMLFANVDSIRDVILFPANRKLE